MQKIKRILIILFLVTKIATAQNKLQLRVSLGNGKPFSSENHVYSNLENPYVIFDKYIQSGRKVKKVFNRLFSYPQLDYMLEYKINKSNTIGFGIQHGATELLVINKKNATNTKGGALKKIGFEYTKTFNVSNLLNTKNGKSSRLYCSFIVGVFSVNHTYNNYDNNPKLEIYKDINGNTTDSSVDKAFVLNNHGIIASAGLRIGKLNKKNNERFSITFLYDHGFTNLWQFNTFSFSNYLNDYVNTTQVARGSQFKIYISMPIGIYNFDKKKFAWKK